MGAFFLISATGSSDERFKTLRSDMLEQFRRQGFSSPRTVVTGDIEIHLYPKQKVDTDSYVEYPDGDFCLATGTILFGDASQTGALDRLYNWFAPDKEPSDELYGAYCAIIKKHGRLFLITDRLGIYKVYKNSSGTVWSSSLLAVSGCQERKLINLQAVYEYAFQGATYGNETVFQDVEIADCDCIYHFDGDTVRTTARAGKLQHPEISHRSCDELLHESHQSLKRFYRCIAARFGSRIDTALSGGYDSRLTLALLQEQGVAPAIHVYGKAGDDDVRIAMEVCTGENLPLEHIDKSLYPAIEEEAFPGVVSNNFYAFDGIPADGIFNNGADLATRSQRCSHGRLMLNGGGGEIFRNFFYLPDRSYRIQQLLWTFYSQFDPRITTSLFSETDYHAALGQKIAGTVGAAGSRLERVEIELVYPLFRCRYWMGKNNSVNNRLGYALTPFIDYQIVRDAVKIPLKYKSFGSFEAAMINRVNPSLAAYNSAYGHNFAADPGPRHVLSEYLTYIRPPVLRRYLYRIKSRRLQATRPYWLGTAYLTGVMDQTFPFMSALFKTDMVRDDAQFNRICTLEYLFQQLSAEHPR